MDSLEEVEGEDKGKAYDNGGSFKVIVALGIISIIVGLFLDPQLTWYVLKVIFGIIFYFIALIVIWIFQTVVDLFTSFVN